MRGEVWRAAGAPASCVFHRARTVSGRLAVDESRNPPEPPPPASDLPKLIAKTVGYEIAVLCNEMWTTLGSGLGVGYV